MDKYYYVGPKMLLEWSDVLKTKPLTISTIGSDMTIDSYLDADSQVSLTICDAAYDHVWLTKDDAVEIIRHLQKVFNLGEK